MNQWLARIVAAAVMTTIILGTRVAFRERAEGDVWWMIAASAVVFPLLLLAEVLADRRDHAPAQGDPHA